jgi:peptidoglycan-associated lipoprotein
MRSKLFLAVSILMAVFLMLNSCSKKTTKVDTQPPSVVEETPPPVEKEPAKIEPPKEETKPGIELSFKTVYFDFDKYEIRSSQREMIAHNANVLEAYPSVKVLIVGNCDERGTIEYNLALGDKRANAVKEYLRNYGINNDRLSTLSYGEEQPADGGHNEEAWAKNRRAEFKIVQR